VRKLFSAASLCLKKIYGYSLANVNLFEKQFMDILANGNVVV